MPKNKVNDPITDQEIVYARLILSGKMSDQEAAEVAGLNPTTAAYTKAKPRVQAWMREHRAATEKVLFEQQAEELRRKSAVRERVLTRLWGIADLSYEQTKGSNSCQVRALAMIVAIEGLVPDRRALPAEKPVPSAAAKMYQAAWLRKQNADFEPEPIPEPIPSNEKQEPQAVISVAEPASEATEPSPQASPISNQEEPTVPDRMSFAEEHSSPYTSFVPDTRGVSPFRNPFKPFNPFGRRR